MPMNQAEPEYGYRSYPPGICGTDISFVAAGITGFIYGHEFAGVDDSGTGYFVEPNIYGGKCEECQSGNTQRCTEPGHTTLGIFSNGGMAETVVVPKDALLACHRACM
jgi:threonine dehydrogenase-like Zn-dependent dehydrogenase